MLLVEDDELLKQVFEKTFSQHGYLVDSAGNGSIAMQKIQSHQYDVILLDVILPDVSGMEVLRNIRNSNSNVKDTPVFITSNLPPDATQNDASQLQVQGYLTKAANSPEEIVLKLQDFFAKKDATVEV